MARKKKTVAYTLDIEIIEKVDKEGEARNVSNSAIVNEILHEKYKTRSTTRANARRNK